MFGGRKKELFIYQQTLIQKPRTQDRGGLTYSYQNAFFITTVKYYGKSCVNAKSNYFCCNISHSDCELRLLRGFCFDCSDPGLVFTVHPKYVLRD